MVKKNLILNAKPICTLLEKNPMIHDCLEADIC